MNKSLPWNLREQVCPAIASSPPPAAVPTAPFPSFISPFFNGLASTSTNSYGATVLTSDTTSLRNTNEILTDTTNTFGGFLAPSLSASRSYLLGDPSCSALSNPPSITSAHDRQQLTAAAAGYLFAQLTSPGTPYHPPTPTQAPATPQQQINPLDSLFSLSPYNQGDVQRQNTTAALVAALKERCRSTRAPGSDMFVNNGEGGGVDLMGASNNLNNSATSSLVAQLSMAGDGSLTANNLASVCAAAAAASTVNAAASTQPPPVATNGESHVAPSSTSSTAHNTPAPPSILSGPTTNFSALVPPIDAHRRTSVSNVSSCNPAGLQSSSESTSSNFLSPQHSSVFQHLVSPQQGQQTSAAVSALSFFPQQSFQTSTEQSPGFQLPASISSSTTSSELIQPPSLGLPTSSSSSSTATFSQQAVPACPSRQPQTLEGQHLSPMNQAAAAAAAALYPQLMCFPALLDNLGPHILRNHMNSAQLKPIPNNERVDLARFRNKNPNEWVMDDVLAWMLDVARRNQVPVENINMHKFATCDGPRLLQMTEQNFQERDQVYGSMLFTEFRKLVSDDLPVHDWIRSYKKMEEDPRLSNNRGQTLDVGGSAKRPSSSHQMPQHLNGLLGHSPISPLMQTTLTQHHAAAAAAVAAAAANQQFLSPPGLTQNNIQRHNQQLSAAQIVAACSKNTQQCGSSINLDMRDDSSLHGVNANSKIKKNKDGRPRKRSQHTKGNKLWEFIRDALKDPSTCPSVVRWEDPIEGVFRIVESEKLARLWGEKKNNHKMTYEKLSRAMRTYYEKNILVPVPKTGLYPKKLVYKFGPGAHGWCAPPHLVAAANAANRMEAMDMS